MLEEENNHRQYRQFDKVFKENIEITLPTIIRDVFRLNNIASSEELPDDVQHTKERKPDILKKITEPNGEMYILHAELQLKDDKEMVYRMAEYSIMLMRKYGGLPVKQYVIFLGDKEPKMSTVLDKPNLKYNYNLVSLSKVDHQLFLKSADPEVKMLAILADLGKEDGALVIETIVKEIEASTKGDFAKSRYFKQMRIFAQLRKDFKKQLKNMIKASDFFKEKDDVLYQIGEERGKEIGEKLGEERGKERGKELATHAIVKNLILNLGLSDEEVSRIAEVKVDYVQKIRAELKDK